MPTELSRPPPDLRYGFTPEDLARVRAVCDQSGELVDRAREAIARSADLLGQLDQSVRERMSPPLPPAGDRVM
jgi:hypothetical protein